MDVKKTIQQALSKALQKIGVDSPPEIQLEHTADFSHGDYATNIALKIFGPSTRGSIPAEKGSVWNTWRADLTKYPNPIVLAQQIVDAMGEVEGCAKIQVAGPGFINFYLSPSTTAGSLNKAANEDMWGANDDLKGKKIMVEYTDPNPFKAFHIGHLMSNAIGEALSRLLQFSGAEVKRANYQGDVGPHVAATLYEIISQNKEFSSAAELGAAYAKSMTAIEAGELEKSHIDPLNQKVYDKSDPHVNELYQKYRKLSLDHFEELYKILGTKFDYYFFESETAPKGLALVKAHPEVFTESGGAVVYKGEQDGLHTRVFITSKGLPTYETKDLGLAQLKDETWKFDTSITVTAQEQSDYFAVMLAAMKKVLPEIAPKIQHVPHGMMRLPTGKMSSRTGDVITGESLLNELIEQAKIRAAESRADDKEKLAQDVAVAAIKYQILKQASGKDIIFDRERALSLEGDSGPYLQYAHARAHQVVEKAQQQGVASEYQGGASTLARLLHRFPEVVERAAAMYEPHLVTNYLLQIASEFNSWYAQEQILDGTPAQAQKVALTAAVARTLKNGLWILGIPAPEKM